MASTPGVPLLLRDPEFRKLPRLQQLRGLRETDPEFATLPEAEQVKALLDPEFLPSAQAAPLARRSGELPPVPRTGLQILEEEPPASPPLISTRDVYKQVSGKPFEYESAPKPLPKGVQGPLPAPRRIRIEETPSRILPPVPSLPFARSMVDLAQTQSIKALGGATAAEVYEMGLRSANELAGWLSENALGVPLEKLQQDFPLPAATVKFAAGLGRVVPGLVDFIMTPFGSATLAQGNLPGFAKAAVSAYFGTEMAKEVPGKVAQALKTKDPMDAGDAVGQIILAALPLRGMRTRGGMAEARDRSEENKPASDTLLPPVPGTKEPWQMTRGEFGNSGILPEWGTRNQYYVASPFRAQLDEMARSKKYDEGVIRQAELWEMEQVKAGKPAYLADNDFISDTEIQAFADENGFVVGTDPHTKRPVVARDAQALNRVIHAANQRALGLALGYEDIGAPTNLKTHKAIVRKALSEGKPVPPEVLKDYPDLQPKEVGGEPRRVLPGAPLPSRVVELPVEQIGVDPARFQFKRETGGKAGVGEELKEVQTFQPELAGVISVWRDPADGLTYVVNGHNRVDLAKKLGQPTLLAQYIQAEDAREARAKGALINVAEGRGTPIDAAKLFRDLGITPEGLQELGVSLKGPVAREGVALARLAEPVFEKVVAGELPVQRAAVIGESLGSHAEQQAALELLERAEKRGKRLTNEEAGELIRFVKSAPTATETTGTLFGDEEITRSYAIEKAELSSYIRQRLARERKLFSSVGTEGTAQRLGAAGNVIRAAENARIAAEAAQAEAVYEKLSTRSGPIADALEQGAGELAQGGNLDAVKLKTYERVREAVSQTLAGKAAEVPGGLPGGGEGGGGPASAGQRGPDQSQPGQGEPAGAQGIVPEQTSLVSPSEAEQSRQAQREAEQRLQAQQVSQEIRFGRGAPLDVGKVPIEESPLFGGARQSSLFGEEGGVARFPSQEGPELPSFPRAAGAVEPIRRSNILRRLSEGLRDLPIRIGGFRHRAAGIYKIKAEVIHARTPSLPVIAHEVGHHINKLLWGAGAKSLNWKPLVPYKEELLGIAPEKQKSIPEGFAEFMRLYLTHPEEAERRAPTFHPFFEEELGRDPDLRDVLVDVRDQVRRYIEQPAVAKVLSQIAKPETVTPTINWERLYAHTVDGLRPVQRVVDEMAKRSGEELATEDNAYELARLMAGWTGKAEHFLKHGTFNARTLDVTGEPLQAILKPLADKLDDLRVVLLSRRTLEKAGQGLRTGVDPSVAREALREVETPELRDAAERLYAYQDRLFRYLVDSGIVSEEQYGKARALNADYAPFYRLAGETEGAVEQAGRASFGDIWSPVKRMTGSQRDIIDPLESIVKNTYTFLNLADRNNVARVLADQAERTDGAGQFVERWPGPMRATSFDLDEVKKALERAGVDVTNPNLDLETIATVFRPLQIAPRGENILTVLREGSREFYKLEPALFRALKGLDQEQANILIRLLAKPASMLRLGATGLSAEFSLYRNPLRDAQTAFLQSEYGFKPGIDSMRGLFHVLNRDELYWEWVRSGGRHAALISLDRTNLQQQLKELTSKPLELVVMHPIEALRSLSEATEAMTRLGEFERAREAGETPRKAGFASREVTLDFQRIGAKTRAVNSIVAFWNANVQGADKFARVHLENPKRTLIRGLESLTVPTVLLYMVNRKDPEYWEQPRYVRDLFWLVPTKGTPLHEKTPFIAIPRPYLWAQVYATIPERIMEYVETRDPSAFDQLAGRLVETSVPLPFPTGLVPLVEYWANKSMFTGRQQVPQYMESWPAEYRFFPWTSEFSKLSSRALKKAGVEVAPAKLDAAIYGYTGGLGRTLLSGLDVPLRAIAGGPERPAPSLAEMPLIRAMTVRSPHPQSQSITDFYQRLQDLEQKFSAHKARLQGRFADAELMTGPERQELARLRATGKRLAGLHQAIRRVYQKEIGGEEKRRLIDDYTARVVEAARNALGKRLPSSTVLPRVPTAPRLRERPESQDSTLPPVPSLQ